MSHHRSRAMGHHRTAAARPPESTAPDPVLPDSTLLPLLGGLA